NTLRCAELAANDPVRYYFSVARYVSTAPLFRELSTESLILSCPFAPLCGNPLLRRSIRNVGLETCLVRQTQSDALRLLEAGISSSERCCNGRGDAQFISEIALRLPRAAEMIVQMLERIMLENTGDCSMCAGLGSILKETSSVSAIRSLGSKIKEHMRGN